MTWGGTDDRLLSSVNIVLQRGATGSKNHPEPCPGGAVGGAGASACQPLGLGSRVGRRKRLPHLFSWDFAGRRPIQTDHGKAMVCPTGCTRRSLMPLNSPSDFAGVLSAEVADIRARRGALFPTQQPLEAAPEPTRPTPTSKRTACARLAWRSPAAAYAPPPSISECCRAWRNSACSPSSITSPRCPGAATSAPGCTASSATNASATPRPRSRN